MTIMELRNLINKKIRFGYEKDAEVIIDGNRLDTVEDIQLYPDGKVAIVGSSTIKLLREREEVAK